MKETTRPCRLAYSYVRFSSPEQKKSDSRRRQWDACEAFCKEHSLVLEKSRRFYDEGISGFRGKHRTEGALGKFLQLVEQKRVPPGSILIVEAFDRLSREDVLTAFNMFTSLLKNGIDVVTLVDRQWYSKDTINQNMGQLFISLGALWSAHNYSSLLSERVGKAWGQKQQLAREEKKPMTEVCPGWLRLLKDRTHYEVIPERAKIVRLIFWLTLRGWGRGRIANLFNRHRNKVPMWGANKNKAEAWHYSYFQKILLSRTVLGEFVPHTNRGAARIPLGDSIKDFYPRVIDEATFLRVQHRCQAPKGPRRDVALNLFQGLLYDGDNPRYSMWFRDHGKKGKRKETWAYVVSDQRRVYPDAPVFSWPYSELENLLLKYLADLDWSSLTSKRSAESLALKKEMESKEAMAAECGKQLHRLIEIAKTTGNLQELTKEIAELSARRNSLQADAKLLKQQVLAKSDFSPDEVAAQIKELAQNRENPDSRKHLREIMRGQIRRIELFRRLPARLAADMGKIKPGKMDVKTKTLLNARCVRVEFQNETERWIIELSHREIYGIRFDGATLPQLHRLEITRDEMGGVAIGDKEANSSIRGNPAKREQNKKQKQTEESELAATVAAWEKKQRKPAPKIITPEIIEKAKRAANLTKKASLAAGAATSHAMQRGVGAPIFSAPRHTRQTSRRTLRKSTHRAPAARENGARRGTR
jgi:DNA invertase Pin-like site-specific DNA recombinase